jgi:hypothetical protein
MRSVKKSCGAAFAGAMMEEGRVTHYNYDPFITLSQQSDRIHCAFFWERSDLKT